MFSLGKRLIASFHRSTMLNCAPNFEQNMELSGLDDWKIIMARQGAILAFFFYLSFGFLDYLLLGEPSNKLLPVRIGVAIIAILVYLITFHHCFITHYSKIVLAAYFSSILGIFSMPLIIGNSQLLFEHYYTGAILCIHAMLTWTLLSLKTVTVVSVSILIAHMLFAYQNEYFSENTQVVVMQLCFMGSFVVLCLYSVHIRNKILKEKIILNRQLSAAMLETKQQKDKSDFLATHDNLTGLKNRNALDKCAAMLTGKKLAMVFVDIDNFKMVNDQDGHHVGDHILKVLGKRLQSEIRDKDIAFRLGGDEFLIIMDVGTADQGPFYARVQSIVDALETPIIYEDKTFPISVSSGVVFNDQESEFFELLKSADKAMYLQKFKKKN